MPAAGVVVAAASSRCLVPTVSVKLWVALGAVPFAAVIVRGYVPPLPAAGVPPNVAVPLPLFVRVTPDGRVPVSEIVAAGKPVVETVKLAAAPTVKVTPAPVVIVGAWLTLTAVLALSTPTHSDRLGVTA